VPLYSRLSQIQFLDDLSVVDQNRQLIRAMVRQLDRVRTHFLEHPRASSARFLTLVSIAGWWVDCELGGVCTDGTSEIIRPNLWIGNLDHEAMKNFRLYGPTSRCAAFVAEATHTTNCSVFESRLDESMMWCPRRVYIGYAADIPSHFLA
jgi:hypothetical protein